MAKKTKRVKRNKKTKSNNIYLPIIVLIAIVFVLAFYFFNSAANNVQFPEESRNTNLPAQETRTSIGGFCKMDSECFVTYCKGQSKDCINSTQMATYSNNCKSYSDWVVENNQDPSVCACSQNYCTMLK